MKYRRLGRTELTVSEVGFGAWAIGGPAFLGSTNIGWGKTDDKVSIQTLHKCLDLGINFIDTADVYGWGHSEELIGKALKDKRDEVIIATKVGNRVDKNRNWVKDFSRSWVEQALEKSLKRLQSDYVDLYQLHSPPSDFEFTEELYDVFEDLKKKGKIRFYGVSLGPAEQGLAVAALNKGDTFQVMYNILRRQPEEQLFQVAQEKDIGVMARVPLASGFLTGKYRKGHKFPEGDHRSSWPRERIEEQIEKAEKLRFLEKEGKRTLAQAALRFCLDHPAVATVIPGAKTPEQLMDNAAASDLAALTADELKRIKEVIE